MIEQSQFRSHNSFDVHVLVGEFFSLRDCGSRAMSRRKQSWMNYLVEVDVISMVKIVIFVELP